jgi:anti-sigma B factor antagonist
MSEFTIARLDGGNGLKVAGELDVATASQLTEAVRDASSAGQVVLDLSELTFMDSCGIRAVIELARAQNGNGPVIILNPSQAVNRVFDIIGIDQHAGIELRRTDGRATVLQAST